MNAIDSLCRSTFDNSASLVNLPSNYSADTSELDRGHDCDRSLSDFDVGGDSGVTAMGQGAEAGGTSMDRLGSASVTENGRDGDTRGISWRSSGEAPADNTTLGSRLIAGIKTSLFLAAEDIERTRRPSDRQLVKSVADDISAMLRRRLAWTDIHAVMRASGLQITIATLRTYHRQSTRWPTAQQRPALHRPESVQVPAPVRRLPPPKSSISFGNERTLNALNEEC